MTAPGPLLDIEDFETFLLGLVRATPTDYADRAGRSVANVRTLLGALGPVPASMQLVHVAGSKGKGTVALMLEALLHGAGLRCGCFTSPHLVHWNERIRIGSRPIGTMTLLRAANRVRPLLDDRAEDPPSFFDVLTTIAVCAFAEAGCEVVILECGLGGEHDATNALDGATACITSIELEHADKLGPTLEDIAWHKAGVSRPGRALICGPLPPGPREIVLARCRDRGAHAVLAGRDYALELDDEDTHIAIRLRRDHRHAEFRIPGLAPHLGRNAALAVLLAWELGVDVDPGMLAAVPLPGRVQRLGTRPEVVVDGAHTPESLGALGIALRRWPPAQRVFVVSTSGTRSPEALARLLRGAHAVIVTCADPTRSVAADRLADALRGMLDDGAPSPRVQAMPERALRDALELVPRDGVLCACGSVYMAGAALGTLGSGSD